MVRKIDGFVINIDDFKDDEKLFLEVLNELRPHYKLTFTSQSDEDFSRFSIGSGEVFSPQSSFEESMFQNVFRRAIKKMSTVPSTTVYLCRNASLLRNAHELLLGTIVMLPNDASDEERLSIYQQFPDFLLRTIADLKECLCGAAVGFGGEFAAAPPDAFIFDGAEIRSYGFPSVPNLTHPDCPVYVAGRYFGYSDPRHKMHALSTRIVSSKKKPEGQAEFFAELFITGALDSTDENIDLITRVPARPGETDRLLLYLNEIANSEDFLAHKLDKKILRPDLLECVMKYPKLKTLNYNQRKEAVKGAFEASADVKGRSIILLDDVQTTGATLNECISVLKKAGAIRVIPIVLGYHPYELQTLELTDDHEMHCQCKAALVGRCNKKGEPFFGCSKWKPDQTHDNRSFAKGMREKLKLMEPRVMQMDEELESEGIGF